MNPSLACQPLRTAHGPVPVCRDVERWDDGGPRRCTPTAACRLLTQAGVLEPRSEVDEPRHSRRESIEFHANGQVARLALPSGTRVVTPLGTLPAELITFHPNGVVRRVLPAAGRLAPDWTEEQEREFVPLLRLVTPLGAIEARFISIHWYPSGALRSLTLWPGEVVSVQTPIGQLLVRQGVSFREDGLLASVEPARPTPILTPLGEITAFDPSPIGLNGDANSLEFTSAGEIQSLVTAVDTLVVRRPEGGLVRYAPGASSESCEEGCSDGTGLRIGFAGVEIRVGTSPKAFVSLPRSTVTVERFGDTKKHLRCLG